MVQKKQKRKNTKTLIKKGDNTVTVRDAREAKLIELLPIFGWTESALKAGYSASYAVNIKERKCNSKRFMKKLFAAGDEAIAMAKPYASLQYQEYMKIRGNVLKKSATEEGYVEKNPTLVTRMGEQMARDSGLRQEEGQKTQVIDIKSITVIQNYIHQQQNPAAKLIEDGGEVLDAEIEDTTVE